MRKRGFVVSQIMVYAFAIMIFTLIIFWGYKSIKTFSTSSEQSGLKSFEINFLADMESMSLKRGSIKEFSYSVPYGYDVFCIIDPTNKSIFNSAIISNYPHIRNSLEDNSENVFLIGKNSPYSFKSGSIRIKKYPYYFCTDIKKNKFAFSVKGTVMDGEISAQILAETISSKNISEFGITSYDSVNDTTTIVTNQEIKLESTDKLMYVKIPIGTITIPGANEILTIEILRSGEESETYSVEPTGATSSNKVIYGLTPKSGICVASNPTGLGASHDIFNAMRQCDGNFELYEFDGII